MKTEYDTDPESIQEGEEINEKSSYCGICFETIYQPILKGIWYHENGKEDHQPIEATLLELLYLRFKKYEDRRGHGEFDVCKSKHCKCSNVWIDFLTKNFVLPTGFLGDHFFLKGYAVCKKNWHLDYHNKIQDWDLNFPVKQGYACPKCIEFLRKKKFIKIIPPTGKNKNAIYNRNEWLKKK